MTGRDTTIEVLESKVSNLEVELGDCREVRDDLVESVARLERDLAAKDTEIADQKKTIHNLASVIHVVKFALKGVGGE